MIVVLDAYILGKASLAVGVGMATAVLVTGFMLRYARRNDMLDLPGQRRSHEVPTPRGGGVGLVLGTLAGVFLALHGMLRPSSLLGIMLAAGMLVAAIGWLDDRRDLPAWPRLLAHFVAASAFCIPLGIASGWPLWSLVLLIPVAAWSINLHNFMDGIDGLLGLQLLFVGLFSALLCTIDGQLVLATANLALSAAATGFLLYNLPPARIFMGDVGSGFAGLLVFMLAALWCADDPQAIWPLLIVHAAFVSDACLTLMTRVLGGRRWYTAHREHLYQWLVRTGLSHGRTGSLYMLYNLAILAPMAWMALREPGWAPWLCGAVYALSALLWMAMKSHCLNSRRRGARHARP